MADFEKEPKEEEQEESLWERIKRGYRDFEGRMAESPEFKPEGSYKPEPESSKANLDDMREVHIADAAGPSEPRKAAKAADVGVDEKPSTEEKVKDRVQAKKTVSRVKSAAVSGDPAAMDSAAQSVIDQAYMSLPADQADSFASEVKALRAELKQRQDRLDMAEVIEKVGHALTQMVGGIYGARHGVNMSGMKFDPTDWDRKRGAVADQFKTDFSDVTERRKANREEMQTAREMNFRASESGKNRAAEKENLTTKEAGEDRRAALRAKTEKEIASLRNSLEVGSKSAAEARLKQKNFDKAIMSLRNSAKARSDEEASTLRSAAESSLMDAGLDPDAIKKIMSRPSEWYEIGTEEDRSPEEAAAEVVKAKGGGVTAPEGGGEVKRQTADGRTAIFDAKTKKFLRYEN